LAKPVLSKKTLSSKKEIPAGRAGKASEARNGKPIARAPKSGKSSGRDGKKESTGRGADRGAAREVETSISIERPVATNMKPRKNQAGLATRELEHFRDLLLEKRREIVGDVSSMEREALRSSGSSNLSTLPIHMADMGTDNYEQEFTLGLVEKDRNLLRGINDALAKIQNGAFGICEGTGKPIAKARLEAQPWARYSIDYARRLERQGMGVK
jgi:DnaK suppressor protein